MPVPELLTLALSLTLSLGDLGGAALTDLGRAMRAAAEDGPESPRRSASTRRRSRCSSPACARRWRAWRASASRLSYTLAPAQIYAWIGVVFAAVMLGGLGRALGPLIAGIVIGVSESVTMAVTAPSWAPLVSFSLLIVVLLVRPASALVRGLARDRHCAGGALALIPLARASRSSTSRSCISSSTGSCSPRRGTSCRDTPAIFRSAMARSSAPGMYTTAVLASRFDVPFLWTLPVAAGVAAGMGATLGAVVFRVRAFAASSSRW